MSGLKSHLGSTPTFAEAYTIQAYSRISNIMALKLSQYVPPENKKRIGSFGDTSLEKCTDQ